MQRYVFGPGRLLLGAAILLGGGLALALAGAYQYLHRTLPDVAALRDVRLQVPLRVYSRDGRLIAQIGEQRRIPLPYEAIPKQLINAVLAAEDDRFFSHRGVDYAGLARATFRHLLSGSRSEGGSTITMQLTRGIFLSREKSYRRKLQEIFLTLRLEQQFSKEEILTLYLNKMFLGQRAYGIGAAAEVYFGKTVDQLTLPEIALIAGTFRLPSRDNPVANAELAKQRRAYVLRRMRQKEYISEEEYQAALAAPVESRLHGPAVQVRAPYVAEMVRVDLLERFGPEIYTGGYRVITTVDSRLQDAAVTALRVALVEYDQRHGYRGPVTRIRLPPQAREADWSRLLAEHAEYAGLQPAIITEVHERNAVAYAKHAGRVHLDWSGLSWARKPLPDGSVGPALQRASDAVSPGDIVHVVQERSGAWRLAQIPQAQGAFVALDPQDGAVVSLVGGFDYFASNFNRAVQARRQPGSAFKPFLYSAALEQGFTAATLVNDAPLVIDDPGLESSWRPRNNSRQFYGPTRLREALVRSRNLVSIRVLDALGPAYATQYIERFGFPREHLPRNLTLALGTAQVSPLEMTSAYAVFANGGYRVEPYYIERVIGPDDQVVLEARPRIVCAECFEPRAERPNPVMAATGAAGVTAIDMPLDDEARFGGLDYMSEDLVAPRAISPQNGYVMVDMMRDVIRRGTGVRARQLNRSDLAGKTGTTNDRRDAWFVGFNDSLVATAWVGFDQERSLGPREEGSRTALPMWIYFMSEALKGLPERPRVAPPGLITMRISADTGLAARPGEPNTMFETFIAGHLPPAAQDAADDFGVSAPANDRDGGDSLF